jgi:hypothetical protein
LWIGALPNVPETIYERVFPVTHIKRVRVLLQDLVVNESHPFINLLFDLHEISFGDLITNLKRKVPPIQPSQQTLDNTSTLTCPIYESIVNESIDISWLVKQTESRVILPQHPILLGFDQCWKEFLVGQGLLPVKLVISGPPKSGKSKLSAQLSQS